MISLQQLLMIMHLAFAANIIVSCFAFLIYLILLKWNFLVLDTGKNDQKVQ